MSRISSHGMNWSARRLTVVVNEAETGRRIPVELVQGEDGVEALRSQLYRWVDNKHLQNKTAQKSTGLLKNIVPPPQSETATPAGARHFVVHSLTSSVRKAGILQRVKADVCLLREYLDSRGRESRYILSTFGDLSETFVLQQVRDCSYVLTILMCRK